MDDARNERSTDAAIASADLASLGGDPQTVEQRRIIVLTEQVGRLIKAEHDNFAAQRLLDKQLNIYRNINVLFGGLGITSLNDTLQKLATFVVYDLNFERCAIFIADDSESCRLRACEGYYDEADLEAVRRFHIPSVHALWEDGLRAPLLSDARSEYADVWQGIGISHCLSYTLPCGIKALLVAGKQSKSDERFSSLDPGSPQRLGLDTLMSHAGTLIDNAILYSDLTAEREQLESRVEARTRDLQVVLDDLKQRDEKMLVDLEQAKVFQQGLLPAAPVVDGMKVAATCKPTDLVGGDYYDITQLSPNHVRLIIVDIAGHGVQASLRTMVIKGIYDEMKNKETWAPHGVLALLNETCISKHGEMAIVFTACCIDLIRSAHGWNVTFSSGGQPLPVFAKKHGGEKCVEHAVVGAWLGVVKDIEFPQNSVHLDPGERLFICTDGMYEERNMEQAEFGADRVVEIFTRPGDDLQARISASYSGLSAFCARESFEDDVTVLAVEAQSASEGEGP